ncbi:MAG: hypothetical protein WC810_28210 [Janthinobacterium sp.]|jgi:hypothetical protein
MNKPQTVMIELPIEDVRYWNSYEPSDYGTSPVRYQNASRNFYRACKDALPKTATISINGGDVVEVELVSSILNFIREDIISVKCNSPEHAEQLCKALQPLVRKEG